MERVLVAGVDANPRRPRRVDAVLMRTIALTISLLQEPLNAQLEREVANGS